MTFIDFARAHGVEIDLAKLCASEKIMRCGTTGKPRSDNGAYLWDGDRGWVCAWDGEARVQWYDDPNAKPWTDEEKRAWVAKREAQKADRERLRQRAALQAKEMIRVAKLGEHDYLHRKGLSHIKGLCLPDGGLLVRMCDVATSELRGAQLIRWTDTKELPGVMAWRKKMIHGMQATGAVLRLGPLRPTETILCEGYATGLSIQAAVRQSHLNATVMICFSDSNMVHVASVTKGTRYCFADNDQSGAGERAARETGLPYCMSDVLGEDANDLHQRAGLVPVCALLMRIRQGVP